MPCVAVVGFFRTGTSAVAGTLHQLGIHMGDRFYPPNDNNPQGYWEDRGFKSLHNSMLLGVDVERHYIEAIRRMESKHKWWGVKDPHLCVLLPNLISNLHTRWYIIHTTRNDQETKASMLKSDHTMTAPQFWDLLRYYQKYTAESLKIYSQPVLHLDFSEIVGQPQETVQKIAEFISLPVTPQALSFIVSRGS